MILNKNKIIDSNNNLNSFSKIDNNNVFLFRLEDLYRKHKNEIFKSGFFSILLIKEGYSILNLDCHELKLEKNNIAFIRPEMTVSFNKKSKDFSSIGLCIKPSFFELLTISNYSYKQLFTEKNTVFSIYDLNDNDSRKINKTLDLFEPFHKTDFPSKKDNYLINFLMLEIIEMLNIKTDNKKLNHSDIIFYNFRKLLANNYKKEHNISFYAKSLNISNVYLSRIVNKVSKHTVKYLINDIILSDAKNDLIFTDITIKELSIKLGFSNQSSFGKFFKKETGLSPINFRKNHRI